MTVREMILIAMQNSDTFTIPQLSELIFDIFDKQFAPSILRPQISSLIVREVIKKVGTVPSESGKKHFNIYKYKGEK
jgi:hypothetical protein